VQPIIDRLPSHRIKLLASQSLAIQECFLCQSTMSPKPHHISHFLPHLLPTNITHNWFQH
jgi:hypothetical protein